MLFDDHKKNLEITITPMDNNKKILTIKKAKYMDGDYEHFIVSGLAEVNIAQHLFIAQDVRLRKGDQVNEVIGIIIQGLQANEDVVKYLVDQLDSDFCHINGIKTELNIEATKEQLALIAAIEDMILPELKEIKGPSSSENKTIPLIPFTLQALPKAMHAPKNISDEYYDDDFFEDDFFDFLSSSIGGINVSGGGYIPCAGIIHGEDLSPDVKGASGYLRDFSICPNIGLTILTGLYKEFYSEYVRNLLIHKVFKINCQEEEDKFTNSQRRIQQLLKLVHRELVVNSKYIRDCLNCPYTDQCS